MEVKTKSEYLEHAAMHSTLSEAVLKLYLKKGINWYKIFHNVESYAGDNIYKFFNRDELIEFGKKNEEDIEWIMEMKKASWGVEDFHPTGAPGSDKYYEELAVYAINSVMADIKRYYDWMPFRD